METLDVKFKPFADRILVEQIQEKEITACGIILPEKSQALKCHAIVRAVGPGTDDCKMNIKVGDHVFIQKFSGTQVLVNKKPHLIIHYNDIYLKVDSSEIQDSDYADNPDPPSSK